MCMHKSLRHILLTDVDTHNLNGRRGYDCLFCEVVHCSAGSNRTKISVHYMEGWVSDIKGFEVYGDMIRTLRIVCDMADVHHWATYTYKCFHSTPIPFPMCWYNVDVTDVSPCTLQCISFLIFLSLVRLVTLTQLLPANSLLFSLPVRLLMSWRTWSCQLIWLPMKRSVHVNVCNNYMYTHVHVHACHST